MIAAALALAAANPSVAYTIDPRHRLVEGIASDGTTIWVSSVLDRTIIACRKTCQRLTVLRQHPLGMAWDKKRELLWIAVGCPKLPGITPCGSGELVAIDRTGRVRANVFRFFAPFFPGDVSVEGDVVWVSNSVDGAVYGVRHGQIRSVVPSNIGKSAQGSALSADRRALIVADYAQGIASIKLESNVRTLLPRQDGKPLRGIDGLVRAGPAYYAIYNGAAPGVLLKLDVAADRLSFTEVDTGKLLPDPTQLTLHGKALYVVADSGWATVEKQPARATGATIVRVPLP